MADKEKKASKIPAGESKRDRFIRVAEPRVRNVLKSLRNLRKCASKATYDYAPEDVERIQKAITTELTALGAAFSGQSATEVDFSFRR